MLLSVSKLAYITTMAFVEKLRDSGCHIFAGSCLIGNNYRK